ncbi:MAG TPA: FAD-dependent oxidoreductase [Candidatus Eisenbacteria bacterium]|nr:FAD-dependent oxidoreductase [Candidatus Eisenbacteria bacterium]
MNSNLETREAAPASRSPLLEEGAAFETLSRESDAAARPREPGERERFDVIVIGGGQAGLSVGHHLARLGISFVILESHPRIGDSWRTRWDSLRLFTPARFNGLDGLKFPAPPYAFPTKDEMGDYLEAYAGHFKLPVRTGTRVERLSREGDRYVVNAGGKRLEASHVVVAMATYQKPKVPAFARELDSRTFQMHSIDYRRPSQLPAGDVLIVGAANSGAEIALDLARTGRRVWVSGRNPGEVPFRIENPVAQRVIMPLLFRVIFHRIMTVDTPIGRKLRPKFTKKGLPLIRTKFADLAKAGVNLVPRAEGVSQGRPRLADGTVLDVKSVVWCTGFDIGRGWIDLPVFDEHEEPVQNRGVVPSEPGLYFVGPHFLYSASSTMIHGIGRDAQRVAETIGQRLLVRAA